MRRTIKCTCNKKCLNAISVNTEEQSVWITHELHDNGQTEMLIYFDKNATWTLIKALQEMLATI